jgi:hypothetical protein
MVLKYSNEVHLLRYLTPNNGLVKFTNDPENVHFHSKYQWERPRGSTRIPTTF